MGISIQARTDYSYLFSGLSNSTSGGSVSNLSFLSDYAMIKNGSYGKLMKAYYAEGDSDSSVKNIVNNKVNSASKDDAETITSVKSATDALKESSDKLLEQGKDSLFAEEDMEKIYTAVNDFVKDYNSVLDTMDTVNSTSILSRAQNMVHNTSVNSKLLGKVGISIQEDNSLAIDKDVFMKADVNAVKNLFHGNGSFAYSTSSSASMINYAAEKEADKAATYTNTGNYGNTYNTGNVFSSLF